MNEASRHPVLRVALPVPLPHLFDYLPPAGGPAPGPGVRVRVPFGRRRVAGIVMETAAHSSLPESRLARVQETLDEGTPVLSAELLSLLEWCARYYKHSPGEVIFSALPPALRRADGKLPVAPVRYVLTPAGVQHLASPPGRAIAQRRLLDAIAAAGDTPELMTAGGSGWTRVLRRVIEQGWVEAQEWVAPPMRPAAGPRLTGEQQRVVRSIGEEARGFCCHLLDGITGSGKTEVYLNRIEQVLSEGKQALVLVPEIGLTPQLMRRFRDRLGMEPTVTHSGLPEQERLHAWAAAGSGRARLIVGTRSALFLPLLQPGLIILDEEHDASFKQQDGFRYSARDVAVKRASGLGIPIILGSATPSLETVENARSNRYRWHKLHTRATGAVEPAWRVVDLRQQAVTNGLARTSQDAISLALERGEQVLVFLNRRGYAPILLCHDCGWHADCDRCDANLTWHRAGSSLRCHHCGVTRPVPVFCPDCAADALQSAGQGTEQLESSLSRLYPDIPLLRFDRDQTRARGSFDRLFEKARQGGPAMLVGTQMLAKGHHLPRITLVVIVNLDQALYSPDFRALERMGQLMVQVAGRAGRDEHPGEVILQTHHPDHPDLRLLMREGYDAFALSQLTERSGALLPPYSHQAMLRADAHDRAQVERFLNDAKRCFPAGRQSGSEVVLYGPVPALMERRRGRTRWYLLAQSPSRADLHSCFDRWLPAVRQLKSARRVRWSADVDPQDL